MKPQYVQEVIGRPQRKKAGVYTHISQFKLAGESRWNRLAAHPNERHAMRACASLVRQWREAGYDRLEVRVMPFPRRKGETK